MLSETRKATKGTVNMKTLKFIGLPMWARKPFAVQPTARPTRAPIRNEKRNMPEACPTVKVRPPANCRARAKRTRVVPSLMSASALRVVIADFGSLPFNVATATASVGASAAPMMSATDQLETPTNTCTTQATVNAVKTTSSVPVRRIPRSRVRTSRHDVFRVSQKSMTGRKISRITCGGRPTSRTSFSWCAGMSASIKPRNMSKMAGGAPIL